MKEDDRRVMERAIIGSVFLDADRCLPLAINEGVDVDWFTESSRQLLWYAIKVVWAETKNSVDYLTVSERAKRISSEKDSPYKGVECSIMELQKVIDETPTTAHFEYYVQLARSEVMIRRVVKAQDQMKRDIAAGADVQTAIQNLERRIVGVLSAAMASRTVSVAEVCKRIEAEYAFAHQKRVVEKDLEYTPGYKLPWRPLNLASQGVQEGLIYLGARPSVGKTAFVLNIIRSWCESGVKVAFNSLDMAIKPLLKRPIGEVSRVSFAKSSFGTTTNEDLDCIKTAIWGETDEHGNKIRKGIADWPLLLMQERNVDVFRSWCIAMKQTGKLDVVVVDFVQLMGTKHRYSNDNEKIEYVSGVLKSIAIDLEIPVIALSQLNRACEEDGGRVPTSSDLRGSGALEQDATAVWILHTDREVQKSWFTPDASGHFTRPLGLTANQTNEEFKGIAPVRIIVAKNQNGQAGPEVWFPLVFFKKYCLFMLGDPDAPTPVTRVGNGVSAKDVTDYRAMYSRVTHDWRNDPFEILLKRHGCLIGGEIKQENMI